MKIFYARFITVLLMINITAFAQQKELRGTWFAWAGSDIPSKEDIAQTMENLAENNFNAVYVDIWRFGYPYFHSKIFENITGIPSDPRLADGRDLLTDMIAEGHRFGLEVEAWFEAGFAACQGDNDDLYDAHPEWFSQKRDGSVNFYSNGGIRYHWLSHCNEEAQQFIIDLCLEIATKYDVDGIDFDRIRYPELNCGYDSATVALYKAEHSGTEPPDNYADPGWIRWRADKLNEFVGRLYQEIKAVNPDLTVSNAPLFYGYQQFCQDYATWVNQGYLDTVVPQLYFTTNTSFKSRLDFELNKVTAKTYFYPGMSTIANDYTTPPDQLIEMIRTSRQRELNGHVIWYHGRLPEYYEALKNNVYQKPAQIPYRDEDWRMPAIVIHENDSTVKKSDGWKTYSNIPGLDGVCEYVNTNNEEWIEYYANIPSEGWYEIYSFTIIQWNAAESAPYIIYSATGKDTFLVNQQTKGHARWYKLGDFYLTAGNDQKIVRLSSENTGSNIVFTDAIMILNSNRPQRFITKLKTSQDFAFPDNIRLFHNYPNPFNPSTKIQFKTDTDEHVLLQVYNVRGQFISTLIDQILGAGEHEVDFDASNLSVGVYFYCLTTTTKTETRKMIVIK